MAKEQCQFTGKYMYPTYKSAATVMNAIRRNRYQKREKQPIRIYRCEHCHRWHLTSEKEPTT